MRLATTTATCTQTILEDQSESYDSSNEDDEDEFILEDEETLEFEVVTDLDAEHFSFIDIV